MPGIACDLSRIFLFDLMTDIVVDRFSRHDRCRNKADDVVGGAGAERRVVQAPDDERRRRYLGDDRSRIRQILFGKDQLAPRRGLLGAPLAIGHIVIFLKLLLREKRVVLDDAADARFDGRYLQDRRRVSRFPSRGRGFLIPWLNSPTGADDIQYRGIK